MFFFYHSGSCRITLQKLKAMELYTLAAYLDELLDCKSFHDSSANGIQVECRAGIIKVALAVDACLEAIEKAAAQNCNLLIVHHGLFWGTQQLMVDPHYSRIRALLKSDMALYAAHLPLDAHPQLGHNAQIALSLGLCRTEPFAPYHGKAIGVRGNLAEPVLREKIEPVLTEKIGGRPAWYAFGPETVQTVGIVAGSATEPELFLELRNQGIDLFITGEPRHGALYMARELGLNIVYGGHYQTETFGMKALAAHLRETLNLPSVFIDTPCMP
jgi:dinuclear metal center YbgI/SA1388 family protein